MKQEEYQFHLEAYPIYQDFAGKPESDPPDEQVAAAYLDKYWLSKEEYFGYWKELQESIFDIKRQLPDMVFKKDFEFISMLGGAIFDKRDFEMLKSCLKHTGDQYFVIIQDTWGIEPDYLKYTFRMKYPIDISWEELTSGNYISSTLFYYPGKMYYVFGDSGKWGKYVESEDYDIHIIGFDRVYRQIFRDIFNIPAGEYCENLDYIPKEERMDLKNVVPLAYRNQK